MAISLKQPGRAAVAPQHGVGAPPKPWLDGAILKAFPNHRNSRQCLVADTPKIGRTAAGRVAPGHHFAAGSIKFERSE